MFFHQGVEMGTGARLLSLLSTSCHWQLSSVRVRDRYNTPYLDRELQAISDEMSTMGECSCMVPVDGSSIMRWQGCRHCFSKLFCCEMRNNSKRLQKSLGPFPISLTSVAF